MGGATFTSVEAVYAFRRKPALPAFVGPEGLRRLSRSRPREGSGPSRPYAGSPISLVASVLCVNLKFDSEVITGTELEIVADSLDDILIELYKALVITNGRNEGGTRGPGFPSEVQRA